MGYSGNIDGGGQSDETMERRKKIGKCVLIRRNVGNSGYTMDAVLYYVIATGRSKEQE